jgi:predicted outer membrane protein
MSGPVLLSAFLVMGVMSCDNDDDEPISEAVSQQDRNFAISSSQFVNAQIAFGQLALENGQDDSVLEFSRLILSENLASKTEFKGIVDSKMVEVAEGITAEMQAVYNDLVPLRGEAFDKAFIRSQITLLEDSKSMFENEIDNGENFSIKGFADKTLNQVKSQKNEALKVKIEIGLEDL